ncbi:MAG: hypothetical protein KAI79_16605 [Bacteroidales bacterium]|nr:hypothetical protein [Bacteroidales bacterium]
MSISGRACLNICDSGRSLSRTWVILLNRQNKIIEKLAAAIIVARNHPYGNLNPSQEDIVITEKIKKAAAFFDISFLDHVIVTDSDYYSFADNTGLF